MDDLLKLAIEAHGGLERWHQFNRVRANASIAGALWHLKGQPDLLNTEHCEASFQLFSGHEEGVILEGWSEVRSQLVVIMVAASHAASLPSGIRCH